MTTGRATRATGRAGGSGRRRTAARSSRAGLGLRTVLDVVRGWGRTRVVWASLLGAMTVVGGGLVLSDGRPGGAPPALVGFDGPGAASIEDVLRTRAPLDRERWTGIVIHHSGSVNGSPGSIAREHESQGLRGLGHHFVIGNGRGAEDGEIHVGYRWDQQLPGAHTLGPAGELHNRRSVGICLVGDGERRTFTDAQLARLVQLVSTLQRELGIADDAVLLHREVSSTPSPGRLFPAGAFRAGLGRAD